MEAQQDEGHIWIVQQQQAVRFEQAKEHQVLRELECTLQQEEPPQEEEEQKPEYEPEPENIYSSQ